MVIFHIEWYIKMDNLVLRETMETMMLLCFGAAWPVSILKSIKAKTTKGKSIFFLFIVLVGYMCGVTSKLVTGELYAAFAVYVLNMIMVSIDIALWFRNLKYDKKLQPICD